MCGNVRYEAGGESAASVCMRLFERLQCLIET
jgi:hypothetical protein